MAQRSINRKKRVRREIVKKTNDNPKDISGKTTREMRKSRTHRFKKKHAALKTARLKQLSSASATSPPSQTPPSHPHRLTVVGKAQKKRVRQPHPTRQQATQRSTNIKGQPRRQTTANPKLSPPPQRRRHRKRKNSSLQLMRLLVAGVGIAIASGFAITLMHPTPSSHKAQSQNALQFQEPSARSLEPVKPPTPAYEMPGKELRQLKQEIRNLVTGAGQADLDTGLFFLNPETHEFVSHRGSEMFPAASMIKLPVLIAFFQDVDAGKVQLNEKLTMRPDLIAGEAGAMQYDQPGSQYDALQTADWMITISDNTATNMIIDRLGGKDVLNQRFQEWGLEHTVINQPLPDLEGTNTMSPKDLAILMAKVSQGDLLSAHSRDRALDILRHTVTKTLLPQGIGSNAQIAHKTGDIGMAVGDAGLVDMPNGQRYVAGIVVKRPHNDPRAQELIRTISKLTYKVFSERPVPRATLAPTPSSTGPSTQPQ